MDPPAGLIISVEIPDRDPAFHGSKLGSRASLRGRARQLSLTTKWSSRDPMVEDQEGLRLPASGSKAEFAVLPWALHPHVDAACSSSARSARVPTAANRCRDHSAAIVGQPGLAQRTAQGRPISSRPRCGHQWPDRPVLDDADPSTRCVPSSRSPRSYSTDGSC